MRRLFAVLFVAACSPAPDPAAVPDHAIVTRVVVAPPLPPRLPEVIHEAVVVDEPDEVIEPPDVDDADTEGILDVDDKCPDEPEDPNGVDDDDGCPDSETI